MSEPVLELKNVTVAFDADTIIQNASMKVWSGDTIVLMGLSGSGKTVLLKTLAGLYKPVQGEVLCHGVDWSDLSMVGKHDLASKVGMQFQKGALFDELDAYDNVAYPLREHTQMQESEIHDRVIECLRSVDLEKAQHLQIHELSGGMRLRLAIARAIALKPEILFLDDPTAGLDPINSDNMIEMIVKLKKQIGATLVIVTHDLLRAYQIAGRIFFILSGQVFETGSAEETQKSNDPRVQQFIQGRLKGPLTEGSEV